MYTELIDLYDRDFNSDLSALTNIGKRISGNKDLMIQFINNINAVYTDSRFIYLPLKYKSDIRASQGLVAHESGHIGYGSFEIAFIKLVDILSKKYDLPPLFVKNLINVVEDVRINGINNIKFPGFYRNLRDLTFKMLDQLKSTIKSQNNILLYINLFLEDFDDFQMKPSLTKFNLSEEDWTAIGKVKRFLLKSLNPSTSILSCEVLCNILNKYIPKTQPSQQTNQQRRNNSLSRNLNPHMNPIPQMNTFNFIENNERNKKEGDKSKLDKISEELIEKLKDFKVNPEDLENLDENCDRLNSKLNGNDFDEMKEETTKKLKKESDEKTTEPYKKAIDDYKDLNDILKKVFDLDDLNPKSEPKIPIEDRHTIRDENEFKKKLKKFKDLIQKADEAMKERLLILGGNNYFINSHPPGRERKVVEVNIKTQKMCPDTMSYNQIREKYSGIIKKMKLIFSNIKNRDDIDTFQKVGRLNNKFIKAITSDYQFKQCFTRKITNKELRILILVDISGSMDGVKIRAAKIAMVMLYEALQHLANLRIVLFTGRYNALNILVKNFNEPLKINYFDKFGCHQNQRQNLDGVSIKHEAEKLKKNDIIIVVSDGQPAADGGYSLMDAIPDIHKVRKHFKIFAFSIDSSGDYLNKLYGKDWVLTGSRNNLELGNKMVKFCQIIVKEFYR
ncbi:MAG: hypothetical protein EU533_01390 [Promethearchaeota archaeon]|nr:MAG: hypothetical protein EU533_01390 [Candidatus Lokiarchaeota archaeon]